MKNITIQEIKEYAKDLICDSPLHTNELGAEYNRGICELIADLDGIPDVFHEDRAQQIAEELGCIININSK